MVMPAPGVEVQSVMAPAHRAGGDFHDCFLIDRQNLAVVIADVSGRGVQMTKLVETCRSRFKRHAMSQLGPERMVQALNDELCADNETMMFVTAFFGVLDLRSGRLNFVNAGHTPPIIRGGPGRVRMLPRNHNLALAVLSGARFRAGQAMLRSGDTLLLYTDGVIEATDPSGNMFGEQRLLDIVVKHRPGQGSLPQELLHSVREFECGQPQSDDIACLALRYVPVAAVLA